VKEKGKTELFFVMMLLFLFGFSILCDSLLGLLGFSSEQYVHPPNYTEVRKSIEFEYKFAANSQGLRYREIPLTKKSPNERRIWVAGDSFTEGWGVEQNETFSARLESSYSASENSVYFINAGLTGTGPLEYMYALFKVGIKSNIDGVLICLFANDVQDTPEAVNFTPSFSNYSRITRRGVHYVLHAIYPRTYILIKRIVTSKKSQQRDIIQIASERAKAKGIPESVIQSWAAKVPPKLLDAANKNQFNGGILMAGLLQPDYWTNALDIETELANSKWRNMKSILDFMVEACRNRDIAVGVVFIPGAFLYAPGSH